MILVFRAIALVSFLVALVWVVSRPGYDSAVATAAALAVLVSAFVVAKERKSCGAQTQNVSGGSVGIQAGRDANVKENKSLRKI